jgi:hypothetical protein
MNTYHNFLLAWSTRDEIRDLKKDSTPDIRVDSYLPFSLNRLIPTPVSLLLLDVSKCKDEEIPYRVYKETGFWDRRDWQERHWGVDDDVTDVFEREGDKNYWALKFTSTKFAPALAIKRLSKAYPMVHFCHKYFSTDTSIAGHVVYGNGELKNEKRYVDQEYAKFVSYFQKKGLFIDKANVSLVVNYTDKLKNRGTTDVFSSIFYEYDL